jgi:hypothetical protein
MQPEARSVRDQSSENSRQHRFSEGGFAKILDVEGGVVGHENAV